MFIKRASPALLDEEVASLAALRATRTVRVPEVLDRGADWLSLELLEPDVASLAGDGASRGWSELGASVAALHRAPTPHGAHGAEYGWHRDNYIGLVPQLNAACGSWPSFWRTRRLEPALRGACDTGAFSSADRMRLNRLLHEVDALLAGCESDGVSLLHGDLWNGNMMVLSATGGAVIDPSCYYGHREVDLAMAALFGGVPPQFFGGYENAYPLLEGTEGRRPVYQLYYLLVHVIMFGRGYEARAMSAVRDAGY